MNVQVLQNYQQRLTNLSSRNRSLKLLKPAKHKDIDFFPFAFEETKGYEELVSLLINFKKIPLIHKLNPHDEKTSNLDKQLNFIYRTVLSIESESGVYSLKVGYPFVQGKFLNDNIARCPLILFPYRLIKNHQNQNRWYLEPVQNEEPHWNTVFFLALQQFHQIKFPENFWEVEFPNFESSQVFWNWLYEQIQKFDLPLKWNSEVFELPYKMFSHFQAHYVKNFPLGELKIVPEALLGLFPETDSSLFEDYDYLIKHHANLNNHSAFTNATKYQESLPIIQVLDIDASQEKVIQEAHQGKNIVVQGPPGTGKSQLIINFIADGISKGKKVLLVSQKRAALDVVYNRLEKLGLQDFVNLVHDHQADKVSIYQKWQKILLPLLENSSSPSYFSLEDFQKSYDKLESQLQDFQHIYHNLYDKKPFGISASELYLKVRVPEKPWDINFLPSHYTYQDLQKFLSLLKEILIYKNLLNSSHIWWNRKNLSQASYLEVLNELQKLPQTIQILYEKLQSVTYKGYYLMEITNLEEIISDYLICNEQLKNNSKFYQLYQFLNSSSQSVAEVKKSFRFYEEQKSTLQKSWWIKDAEKEGITTILKNIEMYHNLKNGFFRFLNPDWWYISKYWERFFQKHELTFSENSLRHLENQIIEYQNFKNILKEKTWLELSQNEIEFAIEFFNRMIFDGLKPRFKDQELDQEHWNQSVDYFTRLKAVKKEWEDSQKSLELWLSNSQIQAIFSELYANKFPKDYLQSLIDSFRKDGHDIIQLDKILEKLSLTERNILEKSIPLLNAYEDTSEWLKMIENQVYWNWLQKLEKLNPNLLEITTKSFEYKSSEFINLYNDFQEFSQKYVYHKGLENLKNSVNQENKAFKEISYQTKKRRSLWSLRKMVENYWEQGLNCLAPCWLVSPEAASAIFPMKTPLFDWIIFDEASQCYVEKAIPVMFRATNTLIIGDSQQLQPYNLYEIKIENFDTENQDIEEEILTDVESLLSFAEHKFQNNKLLWHYRAENQVLIQFSNQHFYQNELRFVPFPHNQPSFLPPIEWVKVNGIWEKNTNLVEAQKVIEILEHLVNHQIFESVGIITFNYHQQQLILDLLDQKLQWIANDSGKFILWNRFIENDGIEKLFVKNIENVQGDERSIIIFSVGYGFNKEGKFLQQFGSLSQKGGENRLNVAVSRAKKKIYFVTSIEPEDIHGELTSRGAVMLKEYLKYAKKCHYHYTIELSQRTSQSLLATQIANRLQMHEHLEVYFPKDGMDLAVLNKHTGKAIAILCEDGILSKSSNIKEIEIYLPKLLQKRGWIVKKLLAKSWLLDSEKILESLEIS